MGETAIQSGAKFRWKKGKDGPPTLTCIRADGSRTWAKQHPFFPIHDLRHYAVEKTLGFREAFFGLVSTSWDIDDFEAPGAAVRLPEEAVWAEQIVGLLDQESAVGQGETEAFNEGLTAALRAGGNRPFRPVTGDELVEIRRVHSELAGQWFGLLLGDTLKLEW